MDELHSAKTRGRSHDRVIERRSLFDRLGRDWPSPVTIVTAPAGFGKTTAVEAWLERNEEAVVWVAVDEDHNDPVFLWTRILDEAIRAQGIGIAARAALDDTRGSPRVAVELFAAELREIESRPVLVLDDVHLIDDPACLDSVRLAIRLVTRHASLVLISRQALALPIERLRGRGHLLRIGPDELAFDRDETRDLLDRFEVGLDAAALEALFDATGGWPAAVYMSALWLRDMPEPSVALAQIGRPDRQLTDYLLSEVIGGLDPEVREFLVRSSALRRISGPLCDDVLGRVDSAGLIARLSETNLLVGGDRRHDGWHQYHALLQAVLRRELEENAPEAVGILGRRAADWFLRNEMVEDAAEQAREIEDHELLTELLVSRHLPMLRSGRLTTLQRWRVAIPAEVFRSRSDAAIAAAMVAENADSPSSEVRKLLAWADAVGRGNHSEWDEQSEVAWQILSAGSSEDGVSASVGAAERAVILAENVPQLRHVSESVLSMFLELAGEPERAFSVATSVIEDPDVAARPFAQLLARGTLALVELERGRVRIARSHVRLASGVIARAGIQDGPIAARIYSCDALVSLAEGDAAAAARAAALSLEHPFDTAPTLAWALLVAATARAGSGDLDGGREALEHAGELIEVSPDAGRLPGLMRETLARFTSGDAVGIVLAEEVSPAEMKVLRLLAEGLSRPEIAESLVVSINTVKTHQRVLYRKLGSSRRDVALARARARGLIS